MYGKHIRGIPDDAIQPIISKYKNDPLPKQIRDRRWLNHAEAIPGKAGLNNFLAEDITTLSATPPWQRTYNATINSTVDD